MKGAVGWRVLEPPDQVLELAGNAPRFAHGLTNAICIKRRPPPVTGDLALDELAEGDTDRGCAEAGAIRGPRFVVDLYSSHPITRRSGAFLGSLFPLSPSSSHVYVVDDVADALEE
jgi:hypothetical protein